MNTSYQKVNTSSNWVRHLKLCLYNITKENHSGFSGRRVHPEIEILPLYCILTPYSITLQVSRDNFVARVVNHTKRRQDGPYIYILTHGGRYELSRIVSWFLLTRNTRRVRALLLSSVPGAPYSSFSRSDNRNARQNETVPHIVYTPTCAPSIPETTVTYLISNVPLRKGWRADNRVEDKD